MKNRGVIFCLVLGNLVGCSMTPEITIDGPRHDELGAHYIEQYGNTEPLLTYSIAVPECVNLSPLVENLHDDGPIEATMDFHPSTYRADSLLHLNPNAEDSIPMKWLIISESAIKSSPLISTSSSQTPWDTAHEITKSIEQKLESQALDSDCSTESNMIVLAEPNYVLSDPIAKKSEDRLLQATGEMAADYSSSAKGPNSVWPIPDDYKPSWHQGDKYSQLETAKNTVYANYPHTNTKVWVAHLDTGYANDSKYLPQKLQANGLKKSKNFVKSLSACEHGAPGSDYRGESKQKKPFHGQRTLSVLAGGDFIYKTDNGNLVTSTLGGDPHANIVSYKIANWSVVHLFNSRMSSAINCAADEDISVLSMSAGGLPSLTQKSAVNKAYRKGVAMFTAAGNFIHVPILGYKVVGTQTVFPARYSPVMAVSGVTADKDSYGKNPGMLKLFGCLFQGCIFDWMLRGSYGPSYLPDTRIAAFSPNITGDYSKAGSKHFYEEGGGTSMATPQSAAAASLWLKHNQKWVDSLGKNEKWKRAEAVYMAMLKSADKKFPKYSKNYFGAGILKANDMLTLKGSDFVFPDKPARVAKIGFSWVLEVISTISNNPNSIASSLGDNNTLGRLEMVAQELEILSYTDRKLFNYALDFETCKTKDCKNKVVKKIISRISKGGKNNPSLSQSSRSVLNEWPN